MNTHTFKDICFTTSALALAKEKIASLKAKDRKYLEQALSNEYEEIYSREHQYMTVADVGRVLKILKIV